MIGAQDQVPVEPTACARCGVAVDPGAGRCSSCGVWQPKNTAALIHGRRSEVALAARQEDALEALAEQREEVIGDLGGDPPRLKRDLADRYVAASSMLTWMEGSLLADGALTAKGNRRALHSAYVAQLDKVLRIALALGLERRQKPAPSVAQYLAAKRAAEGSE